MADKSQDMVCGGEREREKSLSALPVLHLHESASHVVSHISVPASKSTSKLRCVFHVFEVGGGFGGGCPVIQKVGMHRSHSAGLCRR